MPDPGKFERPLANAVRIAVGRSRRDFGPTGGGTRAGVESGAGGEPGTVIRYGRLGVTTFGQGFRLKGCG